MTEQSIMNLGCHVNVDTMDSMKQYTNVFQVFIQPPVRFCFDEAKLLTTGCNLRNANPDCELVVHGPFWPNIQAPNRFIIQSRKMLIQHMNVAKAMGAKYVVTHTGTRRITDKKTDEVTIVSLEESFTTITETLLSFLPSFQKSGVKLLLENTPSVGEKGCSATFILRVVEWFKERGLGDSLGLCFDTEHAWAHGTDPDEFPKYLEAADVIHLNSVPERCSFGEGLDRHTETPLFESYGIAPDTLVRWIKEYPNKLKILEQDTGTATKTFEWLRSGCVPRILDESK